MENFINRKHQFEIDIGNFLNSNNTNFEDFYQLLIPFDEVLQLVDDALKSLDSNGLFYRFVFKAKSDLNGFKKILFDRNLMLDLDSTRIGFLNLFYEILVQVDNRAKQFLQPDSVS